MRILFLSPAVWGLLLCPLWCGSQLEEHLRLGQDAIYELDYGEAERVYKRLIADSPNHPAGYALLAITYWNELLQAAGNLALDDYATPTPFTKGKTYKPIIQESTRFREANDRLIRVCDRILEKDEDNLNALYFKGVAYENLAGEALAITKSTGQAISYGKKARKLHKEVIKKDPSFTDAKLSLGTYEFAVATLPLHWKILLALFLIRGDKEKALSMLEEVGEKGKYRRLDARVALALLHSWKGDPQQAVRIFDQLGQEYPSNYLLDINKAAIYELVLEDPKAALRVYQRLAESLDSKAPGLLPAEVHYRIGRTQYHLHDYTLALESLEKALELPRKEQETPILCYFYMAQIHEQRGDSERARKYYLQVADYDGPYGVLKKEIKESRRKLRRLGD